MIEELNSLTLPDLYMIIFNRNHPDASSIIAFAKRYL